MIHELPPPRKPWRKHRPAEAFELVYWGCARTVEIPVEPRPHHCPACGAAIDAQWKDSL
jgi:hypothetical protein